jgi:hypothetical protein
MKKGNSLAGVKEARQFLMKNNVSPNIIPPSKFAKISSQLGKNFDETLNLIAFLKMGGSNYGPFPYTSKLLTGKYS